MKQIGREYYDMRTRINIREYNLDLINGFATSIANYENRLLLCAELTHKLLHNSSVHDVMGRVWNDVRGNESQFKDRCIAQLVGRVIMTK